jgi:hypothetical protein
MPFLYVLGTLSLGGGYLLKKWSFLCFNQVSDKFNEEVALYSIGLFKWGLLFNLAMATGMYSS